MSSAEDGPSHEGGSSKAPAPHHLVLKVPPPRAAGAFSQRLPPRALPGWWQALAGSSVCDSRAASTGRSLGLEVCGGESGVPCPAWA